MNKETMVDIETLSLRPNAGIISIGACKFNADGLHESMVVNVRFADSNLPGFHIDGETVGFWFKNSQASRDALDPLKGVSISAGLEMLGAFVKDEAGGVWGCGADFDNVILTSAYRSMGLALPWHYRRNRCYRTLMTLFPDIAYERIGELHNAKDDAMTQAKHAITLLKKIGYYPEVAHVNP
jgi:3' exoribonuclease, RNase T-like